VNQAADVELGTFVAVSIRDDDSYYQVNPEHWDEIDAALHNFIERRINKVLALTTNSGSALLLPASMISSVLMSTPEIRVRHRALAAAAKAEEGFSE
jgi:hypothetical protein